MNTINAVFTNETYDEETYDDRDGTTLGRVHITRRFQGDLKGEATAELLTAQTEDGSAVYLAFDRISGRLDGRDGSFVLHHRGTVSAAGAQTEAAVVPGSGTGGLRGLTGNGRIAVDEQGTHRLELEYEFEDQQ